VPFSLRKKLMGEGSAREELKKITSLKKILISSENSVFTISIIIKKII